MNQTTNPALMNTQQQLNPKKGKSKKNKKGKGQDDQVDFAVGVTKGDFGDGPKAGKKTKSKDEKKRKRKDKNKNKQDDLEDAQIEDASEKPDPTTDKGKKTKGSTDEFTSSSDKKKKKKDKGGKDGGKDNEDH